MPVLELYAHAQKATESTGVSVEYSDADSIGLDVSDDLIEEPMDYTPIPPDRLAAPEHPPEEWPEGSGPAGF